MVDFLISCLVGYFIFSATFTLIALPIAIKNAKDAGVHVKFSWVIQNVIYGFFMSAFLFVRAVLTGK